MYLAVNLPHHIATFGGVLLLTASHMIKYAAKGGDVMGQIHGEIH